MRAERLIANRNIVVCRVEHDEEYVPHSVEEEVCDHFAINFVESGEFELASEKKLQAGDAFVCQPGTGHTYIHRDDMPADVCVAVVFNGALATEIERNGWNAGVRPATSNIAFLRRRLARIVADADSMRLEEWAGDVVDAVRTPIRSGRWHREWQLDLYADRIETIRRLMQASYDENHSLISLADKSGMSAFHFARVFRELVGVPPHRYLRNIRLERASAMLRDGASVTSTCYDVGFSNLSHFIRSFRRRYGCPPSELRKKVQAKRERTPA